MKYFKRFLLLAFILLLGVFAFRNQTYLGQRVDLVFLSQPVSMVLGFWLVLCFLAGLLVYMVIDMPRDIVLKRELRRKTQEAARLQTELNRIHAAAAGAPQPLPPGQDLEKRLGL
ncbi:MAG TPA: LapA family protein [Fibrobacteria bacterium]|nr:LapA family protein [Fibrobacteria bacterium]